MTWTLSEYIFAFETFLRNFWEVSPKNQNYAVISKKGKKLKICIVMFFFLTPECELKEIKGKYLEEHILLGHIVTSENLGD